MSRALYSGLAGTRANQDRLDVIGNNLANANTVGFKQSRVTFYDTFYQTLSSGTGATATTGGTNPMQIGSGAGLGTVQTLHSQGAMSNTGQALDVAIEGQGMFVVEQSGTPYYTRDGSFTFDDSYSLVSAASGARVQGWLANGSGVVDTSQPMSDLRFPIGQLVGSTTTGKITMGGNLNAAWTAADGARETSISVYDSLGNRHTITVSMERAVADNTWDVSISCGAATQAGQITFDANGNLSGGSPLQLSFTPGGGASGPQVINVDFAQMTQMFTATDAVAQVQDGSPPAALQNVVIQDGGIIMGNYSDGVQRTLGQLALAAFGNVSGLEHVGNNMYRAGIAAGDVLIGEAGTGGRGRVIAQALELSNVDITEAFVDMISTQRAFQASTRVISAADDLLQEVMRLAK